MADDQQKDGKRHITEVNGLIDFSRNFAEGIDNSQESGLCDTGGTEYICDVCHKQL